MKSKFIIGIGASRSFYLRPSLVLQRCYKEFELAIRSGPQFIITLEKDSILISGMEDASVKAYQTYPNHVKLSLARDIIEKSLLCKKARKVFSSFFGEENKIGHYVEAQG